MTEISNEKIKALGNIDDKLLDVMKNRSIIASYLLSPLSKLTNPEHTSQTKLVKDPDSKKVNDLFITKTVPVTLYIRLISFPDTNKKFKLQGDLLKMITNKNYNVYLANSQDKEIMYDFAKEMYFDGNALGNKSVRDKSLI